MRPIPLTPPGFAVGAAIVTPILPSGLDHSWKTQTGADARDRGVVASSPKGNWKRDDDDDDDCNDILALLWTNRYSTRLCSDKLKIGVTEV